MDSSYRYSKRNQGALGLPFAKTDPQKKQAQFSFFSDKDSSLILMLILLLQSDGADELLIMALLYILT